MVLNHVNPLYHIIFCVMMFYVYFHQLFFVYAIFPIGILFGELGLKELISLIIALTLNNRANYILIF